MADHASLMQPLRTESLRLRPVAQAQYEPPRQTEEIPEAKPASSPLMAPLSSLPAAQPKEMPNPKETSLPDPPAVSQDDTLESLLQNFADDVSDEDSAPDEPDAIPTDQMPVPVFVPLYEAQPSRRRIWPWIVLSVVILLAAAGFAAWKTGLWKTILP